MDKIIIRKLQPTDADDVSRISSSITRGDNQADFQNIIKIQAQSEADASFVAVREKRLVGYCISHVLAGSFGIVKSAWVAHFGVEPDFMGQGIGELLAKETLQHYKTLGIVNIYTSVRWDATDLLSFYKTLGFQRSDFINLYKHLE
jgi:predicted N-acetyltransferase YhbS